MSRQQEISRPVEACGATGKGTKCALWWLKNYESITHFWRGFSWVWVIGVIVYTMMGHLDLGQAVSIIFVIGIIANSGIYFSIRAVSSHLKHLEEGPEKEEAYRLMIEIIKRRGLLRA